MWPVVESVRKGAKTEKVTTEFKSWEKNESTIFGVFLLTIHDSLPNHLKKDVKTHRSAYGDKWSNISLHPSAMETTFVSVVRNFSLKTR